MTSTPKSTSTTSGTTTPSEPPPQSSTSYLSYPVTHIASSLYRRLTEPSPSRPSPPKNPSHTSLNNPANEMPNGVYTPPYRTASPFQPPPLTPLTLSGSISSTILSRAVAEEIRLLVPPRLQLAETWTLAYSLEQDGVSLGTLYNKCASPHLPRDSSFILVIQDAAGGIFGAYLTDPPHPHPSFYGTGECFLWRSSILPPHTTPLITSLPPPPSASETEIDHIGRSTTISSPSNHNHNHTHTSSPSNSNSSNTHLSPPNPSNPSSNNNNNSNNTNGTNTPDLIRFKAFPYSGVNDYLIFCQHNYLSIGGGDGHYGLWLDGVLETGVSSTCMTFGNEGLSEEGEKFEVVGVEVWCVGGGG
ncbi:hypothetical protein JMJ35_000322 [Cladonia borealis]|uniref:Oxidation resistance protein 1 n=1 Tax=Cladonia borealis TaxID=184061 RepID=A0AA39V5P6_9LECA|nr:hypothetical protein JMJ35_000322 [Cladonia borealis]